jgi:hypothetical protein
MRQLTNPAVDTSDGKRKRTPPTSPSRNVVVINTHVHNRGLSARDSTEGKTYTYIAPNIYVRRTEHMRYNCLIQFQMCIITLVHDKVLKRQFHRYMTGRMRVSGYRMTKVGVAKTLIGDPP